MLQKVIGKRMGMFAFQIHSVIETGHVLTKVLAEEGMDISHVEFSYTMLLSMIIFLKI